jgi:hypothetical protein
MSNDFKEVNHVDDMFPTAYMKAGELGGNKPTYTIKHIEARAFEGDKGKQWKGIATVEEIEQQWTINKTNMLCIKAMFGELVPAWYGKRITLFPTKDRFGREIVDCIRVWGSPDIERDVHLEVKFPKKKPQKWVMHKVTDQSHTRPAARPEPVAMMVINGDDPIGPGEVNIQKPPARHEPPPPPSDPVVPAKFKFSPEGRTMLHQMKATTDVDMLGAFPIAINAGKFSPEEQGQLLMLVEKRRAQILTAPPPVASDDIPY